MKRRPRVFSVAHVPSEIRDNGYAMDLITAVRAIADAHRAQPTMIQKNGDWYAAVLIPNAVELREIDRVTDSIAETAHV